ncbi:MAG: sigma factor [Bacilli bacterium]
MSSDFDKYDKIAHYLASSFFRKYKHFLYHHRDDLHQEAVLATLIALKEKHKVKHNFTTYVYHTVRNRLRDYVTDLCKHKNLSLEELDIEIGYDLSPKYMQGFTDKEMALFTYKFLDGNPTADVARKFCMRRSDVEKILENLKDRVIEAVTES